MEILEHAKTTLGNDIELIGNPVQNGVLVIGVFHGDEPQGKILIDEYLKFQNSNAILPLEIYAQTHKNPEVCLREDFGPPASGGQDCSQKYKRYIGISRNLRNNMTKEEVILWQYLRGRQINGVKFRRQCQIGKYICDFVSFSSNLVIEIDGGQHNYGEGKQKDIERDFYLKSRGFKILRFWNTDIINNIEGVLAVINKTLTECAPLAALAEPAKNEPCETACRMAVEPKSLISKGGEKECWRNLLFIPCLNPDGMQLGKRTNSNGVDLNRNFPTKNWGQNKGENATCDDCTSDYFGGVAPASEIETQFVINVIEKYSPSCILALHAPYKVVNYDGPAKEIAQEISKIIGYPAEGSIGYPTPGSFGTYCGVERNIPTITLELDEETPVENLIQPMFEIFELLDDFYL